MSYIIIIRQECQFFTMAPFSCENTSSALHQTIAMRELAAAITVGTSLIGMSAHQTFPFLSLGEW